MGIVALIEKTNLYRPTDEISFRYWQVEALLNQAADLLDRCDEQRTRLLALEEQKADLLLRVRETSIEKSVTENRLLTKWFRRDADVYERVRSAYDSLLSANKGAKTAADNDYEKNGKTWAQLAQKYQTDADVNKSSIEHTSRKDYAAHDLVDAERITNAEKAKTESRGTWLLAQETLLTNIDNGINALTTLIESDFEDGYNRASVAARGLEKIFGYQVAFPLSDEGERLPLMDRTIYWVRGAIRYMAAFLHYDQTYVITISIRQSNQAGFLAFKDGIELNRSGTLSFAVPYNTSHHFVRFKGLSATLINGKGIYSASITFPRSAISLHSDGSTILLDQRSLPPCLIGRVLDVNVPRSPEIAGTVALMNASPFGYDDAQSMQLSVSAISGDADFEDIFLDFIVSGRPN